LIRIVYSAPAASEVFKRIFRTEAERAGFTCLFIARSIFEESRTMSFSSWRHYFRSLRNAASKHQTKGGAASGKRSRWMTPELLEARLAPAVFVWKNVGVGAWNSAANWTLISGTSVTNFPSVA
jgi:hypothetical protein